MSGSNPSDLYDILAPDPVEERFGITTVDYQESAATAVLSLPFGGMCNPVTGASTVAPLALLVDDAGSTVAFACRRHRWPVTSELTLQLEPDAQAILESGAAEKVYAHAHVVGRSGTDAHASCQLTFAGRTIGAATLRAVYISGEEVVAQRPSETLPKTPQTSLADLLAVTPAEDENSNPVLLQGADPMVCNAMANIHGGVAATCLELVASACISSARQPFRSGSLHINYLRPFFTGADARYIATSVHTGSTVAVADAAAVGSNGKRAVIARLTAYRVT